MIMILIGAIFAYCWHGDDRGALRMAEAIMAHRAIDKPANAHMFLRPDYEQRCSDRFGQQHLPGLAREELQAPVGFWLDGVEYCHDASRRAVFIAEAFIGTAMPPIPS